MFDPTQKAYYPYVIYDANQFSGHGDTSYFKMWFTGRSGSNYAIGYARIPVTVATPEAPIGGIVALFACLGAVAVFKLRKK